MSFSRCKKKRCLFSQIVHLDEEREQGRVCCRCGFFAIVVLKTVLEHALDARCSSSHLGVEGGTSSSNCTAIRVYAKYAQV